MEIVHKPVLLREALEYLAPERGGRFVDGTLGQGGHAEQILSRHPSSELLGIDRDAGALAVAAERLAPFGSRVKLFRGEYSRMEEFVGEAGWGKVDGILLDIGFGSHQLDDPGRGFSFRVDAPLDMRMDRRSRQTAATLLNHSPEAELARIFREYGEEPQARRLTAAIVRRRQERPWTSTGELAALIVETIRN
mgnify:CR=1 FL=1